MFEKNLNTPGRILRARDHGEQQSEKQQESAISGTSESVVNVKISGAKISNIALLSMFAIIMCVNRFFYLVPWGKVAGKFNASDVGLFILLMFLAFLLLSGKSRQRLNNKVTYVVLLYLLIVVGQVANVSFNFGQSIIDGLIASRHQLYYLSFFAFLMMFDNERQMKQFLNFMLLLAVALSVLGMINYFGIIIFYHKWAEGQGERAGVTRAFFAGVGLIAFSLIWVMSQWVVAKKINTSREFSGALLILALVMRQTRSFIIGIFIAAAYMLVHKRKIKVLVIGSVLVVLLSGIVSVYKGTNVLLDPFSSAYEDVSEGGGTWAPRVVQLQNSITTFMQHPVFGAGTYAIRLNPEGKTASELEELALAHENADLGYIHWLKAYGIIGVAWLLFLYMVVIKLIRKNVDTSLGSVGLMSSGYMIFVMASFITIPHFIWADKILLLCLALALMVRSDQLNVKS